jgi:hypothetical protein
LRRANLDGQVQRHAVLLHSDDDGGDALAHVQHLAEVEAVHVDLVVADVHHRDAAPQPEVRAHVGPLPAPVVVRLRIEVRRVVQFLSRRERGREREG